MFLNKVDYSDSIGRRTRGGFFKNQKEFEIAEAKDNETPLQRFHR
jgi:hypothetical protein